METCPFGHGHARSDLRVYNCKDFSVDINGNVNYGQLCWRSKYHRKNKAEILGLIARELSPYTLYFDDDARIFNWGGGLRCFCPLCVNEFNRRNSASYTREELAQKVETDVAFREKYIEFSYEGIAGFCYEMAKAVAANSPVTHMGVESGHYSGVAFLRCLEAMYKGTGKTVRSRCGAGAYSDYYPTALTDKTFETGWQLARLPAYVDEYCNEIENFPSSFYSKTPYGTCLEASAHLASGFNCVSMKCWRMGDYEMFEDVLRESIKRCPYWEKLAACNRAGCVKSGLQMFVPQNYLSGTEKNWAIIPTDRNNHYNYYGIPITYAKTKATAYYFDEIFAETISVQELEELLRSPVATSAAAIYALCRRGFSKILGIAAEYIPEQVYMEEFTDNVLNDDLQDNSWGQNLFARKTYCLIDESGNAEVLGRYRLWPGISATAGKNDDGAIASAIVRMPLGGTWFVQGYRSDDDTISWAKRQQINRAIRHITGGLLAEHISRNRLMLSPIENENGKLVNVSVINPTIADQKDIVLLVRNLQNQKAYLVDEYGKQMPLALEPFENGYKVRINDLRAWSIKTVFFE